MDDKAHGDQPIDDLLDLGLLGPLLHDYKHEKQLWHSAARPHEGGKLKWRKDVRRRGRSAGCCGCRW